MKLSIILLVALLTVTGCSHKKRRNNTNTQTYPRDVNVQYKALIVGLNNYGGEGSDLFGIDKDVANMKRILEGWGFDITMLTEAESMRFEEQMQHYASTLDSDDVLIIYFSGHGSHTPDHSGDEADGWDESIVLSDGTRNLFFIDDRIDPLLTNIKARKLYIVDTCYSGTVFKMAPTGNGGSSQTVRSKYLPAPPGVGDQNLSSFATYKFAPAVSGPLVTLAACRDNEESLASTEGSLFTNALVSSIGLDKSFKTVHTRTSNALNDRFHPVLSASDSSLKEETIGRYLKLSPQGQP